MKYIVNCMFLIFIMNGCSYKGEILENEIFYKKTIPTLIENNIYYDEQYINMARNLIFSVPLTVSVNIDYKKIVNNYSKKILSRSFKNIKDKNSNILVTTDANIDYVGGTGLKTDLSGELSINFINKKTNNLIKKYSYKQIFQKESLTSTQVMGFFTGFTLCLICPVSLPLRASNEGKDFEIYIEKFFQDGFKKYRI